MKNLLLTGSFPYSYNQINEIKLLGFNVTFVKDEFKPLDIDVSVIDAVVCNNLFLYNDIKKFTNLKFIQLTSAGCDRVPLNYIKKKGIKLLNANSVYSIPMAEWVILKILEIYKKSRNFYNSQYNHEWRKQRDLLELTDKTVAIVGFGNVGKEVAKRLKPFGVNILAINRSKVKDTYLIDQYIPLSQLDSVISRCDIIILTLALTSETRNIINSEKIEKMKDDSVLINVSRGALIDETALIEALINNKFLGIALDVFEQEPLKKDSPLWNFERVIITPHNSFVSDKIYNRLYKIIINNLRNLK